MRMGSTDTSGMFGNVLRCGCTAQCRTSLSASRGRSSTEHTPNTALCKCMQLVDFCACFARSSVLCQYEEHLTCVLFKHVRSMVLGPFPPTAWGVSAGTPRGWVRSSCERRTSRSSTRCAFVRAVGASFVLAVLFFSLVTCWHDLSLRGGCFQYVRVPMASEGQPLRQH